MEEGLPEQNRSLSTPRPCRDMHQKGPKVQGTLLLKRQEEGKHGIILKSHSSFRCVYLAFQTLPKQNKSKDSRLWGTEINTWGWENRL